MVHALHSIVVLQSVCFIQQWYNIVHIIDSMLHNTECLLLLHTAVSIECSFLLYSI